LRLKASLLRCKRLTDSFAESQLKVFAPIASKLGLALGIPEDVRIVFAEAEIRCAVADPQAVHAGRSAPAMALLACHHCAGRDWVGCHSAARTMHAGPTSCSSYHA
jgi:hypothetical protein